MITVWTRVGSVGSLAFSKTLLVITLRTGRLQSGQHGQKYNPSTKQLIVWLFIS